LIDLLSVLPSCSYWPTGDSNKFEDAKKKRRNIEMTAVLHKAFTQSSDEL
jgi:hypothetical protein